MEQKLFEKIWKQYRKCKPIDSDDQTYSDIDFLLKEYEKILSKETFGTIVAVYWEKDYR